MKIAEIWRFETGAPVPGCPAVVSTGDGVLVVYGTENGDVIALDGAGREVWRDHAGPQVAGWPAVVDLPQGTTVLVGDAWGTVHAYAPDGAVRWRRSMGKDLARSEWFNSGISPWSGIAALRGSKAGDAALVVTDRCGNVSALTADGDTVWRANLDIEIGIPAVGDIDGDGSDEIVVATWTGRVHCLGADGALRWTTDSMRIEAAYTMPLLVDWGEGPRVIVQGEADGIVCCLDGAGKELWRHTSRGAISCQAGATPIFQDDACTLFVPNSQTGQQILSTTGEELWYGNYAGGNQPFGPSIADIDGDGKLELLMSRRSFGARTLWILDTNGESLLEFDMSGSMTGSPVVGDLNGDGVPEFVIVDESKGTVRALRIEGAKPGGEITWPSSKGAFDGRRSVLRGAVAVESTPTAKPLTCSLTRETPVSLVTGPQPVKYTAGDQEGAFVQTSVTAPSGKRDVYVRPLDGPDHGSVNAVEKGTYALAAKLISREGVVLAETAGELPFVPFEPEFKRGDGLLADMRSLAEQIGAAGAGFTRQVGIFSDRWDGVKRRVGLGESSPEEVREFLDVLGTVYQRRRCAHERGVAEFILWNPGHPWVTWSPTTDTPPDALLESIALRTERRAHEATPVTIANVTGRPLTVRVWLDCGTEPLPEGAVTLRRPVFVSTAKGNMSPDALPALDEAGLVTIPADETARVWVDWSANGLEAGSYSPTLRFRALSVPGQQWDVPVTWDVLPVAMPESSPIMFHVWAYENAKIFHSIDAVYKDLLDHHVNVFDLPVPVATYDAEGNIASEDFAAVGDAVSRVPEDSFFLWHGADTIARPEEGAPAVGTPEWERAFRTHVQRFMEYLRTKGVGYDRHANYIIDEPGIEGGRRVDLTVRVAKLYKAVDPKIRIFTNPAGGATAEHIDRLVEVADIFDPIWHGTEPGYVHLPRILAACDTVWTYNCGDGVRDLPNMSYYWSMIWKGAEWGMTGIGHWSYAGRQADFWNGKTPNGCDWELVYPGAASIVPSRRWQAVRIGVEDGARLALVKDAAATARAAGKAEEAERLERERAEVIASVVAARFDEAVVAEARAKLQEILLRVAGEGA